MFYAQLTNGVVTSVTETHSQISAADMIPLDLFDVDLIGHAYMDGVFTPPAPTVAKNEWWIHVGAFYDRFGLLKIPILASTDPIVQAIIRDSSVRKYIDLQRPDLDQALDTIISKGFAIDKTAIMTTPIPADERYVG